jgi:2'-5' RNA ligase
LFHIGIFDSERHIRVLWAAFVECKALKELKQKIDAALPKYVDNHSFKAHVTLARIAALQDTQGFIDELKKTKLQSHTMAVTSYSLMKSELLPTGAIYGEVARFGRQ